ncbi:hypothetical protein D3C85_1409750 [compost metagenome]
MGAVTDRWAGPHVAGGTFAVAAAHAFEGGFGADTGRDLVGRSLDAIVNPVVDPQAFLAVRVVHDDGVAQGARGAGVPAQCRGLVLAATTGRIAGGCRGEQAIVRDTGDAEGEALLGLRRKLHAKGDCNGRQPRGQGGRSGHTGAPCAGGAMVGVQTIAGPLVPWQRELAEPRKKPRTLN